MVDIVDLKNMVYSDYKIYGPYTRKDKRQHVIVIHNITGERKTVSYPKYIVERYLGRYLENNETVHHIDGNFSNNNLSSLKVIDRSSHASNDCRRLVSKSFVCPICLKTFVQEGSSLSATIQNRRKGKAGPFCSRSCAGKYGKNVQLGQEKLETIKVEPEYTTKLSPHEETCEVDTAKTGEP